jgi:hypothetical protein
MAPVSSTDGGSALEASSSSGRFVDARALPGGCRAPAGMVDLVEGSAVTLAASPSELDGLLGCETRLPVDWTREKIAVVAVEGANSHFAFRSASVSGGVATIVIHQTVRAVGASFTEQILWLIPVAAEARRAVVDTRHASDHVYPSLP